MFAPPAKKPRQTSAPPDMNRRDMAAPVVDSESVTPDLASSTPRQLQAQLNQSPRPRALAQLKASLKQTASVAGLAQLSVGLQAKPAAPNRTGLPDRLKAGIEALSGMDLSDVRAHANSPKPAQLNAQAYAQGDEIHLAPGQDRHLAHEAWHVVQQRQGRVRPTAQAKGVSINDDQGLEHEADVMGARALRHAGDGPVIVAPAAPGGASNAGSLPVQGVWEPLNEAHPDWRHDAFTGAYHNAETGGRFYPDQGVLDHPGEPGGFHALEDDEAQALQQHIDSGHWTGLFVNSDNDMLFDPKDRVLSFLDRPEIRMPVDAREAYFTLLDIQRDGVEVDAEVRQALEDLRDADDHDERGDTPARQITRGANIGFEFQELGSKIKIVEAPSEDEDDDSGSDDGGFSFDRGDGGQKAYDRAMSRAPQRIPTNLYGKDSRWYVVADGANLEFVTLPFESMADLRATMSEVRFVAMVFAEGDPDTSYLLGDTVVHVLKAEGQAQPQANTDIPLDTLHNFIEDVAGDEAMHADLFGVTGMWNPAKTRQEMGLIAATSAAIQALSDAELQAVFGLGRDAPATRMGNLKGMLELLANAAIHRALFPGALEKDQPVLLKTHMGETWKSLVASHDIVAKPRLAAVAGLLIKACPDLDEDEVEVESIVGQVMAGTDPVWASEKKPVNLDEPGGNRKQVVIELRRVPVLPIDEWTQFAEDTYRYFISDAAERFS